MINFCTFVCIILEHDKRTTSGTVTASHFRSTTLVLVGFVFFNLGSVFLGHYLFTCPFFTLAIAHVVSVILRFTSLIITPLVSSNSSSII